MFEECGLIPLIQCSMALSAIVLIAETILAEKGGTSKFEVPPILEVQKCLIEINAYYNESKDPMALR